MIQSIILIFLLFSLSSDCLAGENSMREAVQTLAADLVASCASKEFPREMESFIRTVSLADEKLSGGDAAASSQLYQLARMKGELLASRSGRDLGRCDALPAEKPDVAVEKKVGQPVDDKTVTPAIVEDLKPYSETAERQTVPEPVENSPAVELPASIVGGEGIYTVRRNDTLSIVSARLGVSQKELVRRNKLDGKAFLKVGQKLRYNDRRIVPKSLDNGILVNIPDRSLYLFKGGRLAARYPVAVGMVRKKSRYDWRTPVGRFRVTGKLENPSWTVPKSIRQEMEERGEEVIRVVPPGPQNPLGKRAIKLSIAGIMIHGTSRPTSINSFSSHGCIRVMPENMETLFSSVKVSMPGEIIYQPVKVAVTGDNRVFLEVNRDVYGRVNDIRAEVEKTLHRYHVGELVSWNRVMQVINDSKGIAEEVTLQ